MKIIKAMRKGQMGDKGITSPFPSSVACQKGMKADKPLIEATHTLARLPLK